MRRLPGSHPANIKNRSSKHLGWLTGYTSAVRSMSNAALSEINTNEARSEIRRRNKKHEKQDAK